MLWVMYITGLDWVDVDTKKNIISPVQSVLERKGFLHLPYLSEVSLGHPVVWMLKGSI